MIINLLPNGWLTIIAKLLPEGDLENENHFQDPPAKGGQKIDWMIVDTKKAD